MKCSFDISNFLEEISSLSPSVVFLYFFALFIEEGLLVSSCCNSAFSWLYISLSPLLFTSLLSSTICKDSSDNHFAFLHFFSLRWLYLLPPVQYYEPLSIVLQALYLLDIIPWIYLSPPFYIHSAFYLSCFPQVFSLSLNFATRSWWYEPHSTSGLVFPDCIEVLHLQLQAIQSIWFRYWPSGDVHV